MRRPLSAMLLACGVCGAHAGNLVYVGAGVVRDKLSDITTADGFTLSDIDRTSWRSEEHTSELQSPCNLVCRLLLEKKKINTRRRTRTHISTHTCAHLVWS